MTKFDDWPERLLASIAAARAKKFAWGRHDCALFAADCVREMTGVDPAAAYRGRYADRRGAYAVLRASLLSFSLPGPSNSQPIQAVGRSRKRVHASNALAAAWTAALGAPLDCPLYAQRGDVVLVDTDAGAAAGVVPSGGPATGVVVGGAIAAAGPDGLVFLPLRAALRAWRV